MKGLKLALFLTFISNVCFSQISELPNILSNKNYFEVNYPNYYYHYRLDKRFHLGIPLLNLGFKYKNINSKNCGIQTSIYTDFFSNIADASEYGHITARYVLYPSFGWHKSFLLNDRKNFISIEGSIIGRIGQLTIFEYENFFETLFGYYELFDAGVSVRGSYTYVIREKLCLNMSLSHAFFAYVFDDGTPFYNIPSSPRNVTMLNLGIGFLGLKKSK